MLVCNRYQYLCKPNPVVFNLFPPFYSNGLFVFFFLVSHVAASRFTSASRISCGRRSGWCVVSLLRTERPAGVNSPPGYKCRAQRTESCRLGNLGRTRPSSPVPYERVAAEGNADHPPGVGCSSVCRLVGEEWHTGRKRKKKIY